MTRARVGLLLIAVAAASATGALIVGQAGNVFPMPPDFADMPLQPSPEYMARYNAAFSDYRSRNYAVHFLLMGACLGVAVGTLGAIQYRGRSIMAAACGGALGGGLGGFVLGKVAAYLVQVHRGETFSLWGLPLEPIVQTTALQCFVWACIGVGIGVGWTAAQWGKSRVLRGLEGGLVGGILAGGVHCMITALVFSNSSGFTFIPEQLVERLLWSAICGTSVAAGLVYSVVLPGMKVQTHNSTSKS